MKRNLLITLTALLMTTGATARETTLFDGGPFHLGWFGGPTVNYTRFHNQDGVLVGGQGACLISHKVYLGFAGYGLASHANAPDAYIDSDWHQMRYDFGYGGGLVGVIIKNDELMHATADVLIGGGGLTWRTKGWQDDGE
jgi:hypothetical protein